MKKQPHIFRPFFYSDPHFGHKNVILYCKRPFSDIKEMEIELIKRYNEIVPEDGLCIWLGDGFFHGNKIASDILSRMNGRKWLIRGNHDPKTNQCYKRGFEVVVSEMKIMIAGKPVRLNHYPYAPGWWDKLWLPKGALRYLERRPPRIKGEWLLCGHTHQTEPFNIKEPNIINCGCDAHDLMPVSFDFVEKVIQKE